MNKGIPITVQNYTNEYLEIIIRCLYVISDTQACHCSQRYINYTGLHENKAVVMTVPTQGINMYRAFSKIKCPPWCGHVGAVISMVLDRLLLCSLKHIKYM